MNFYFAAIDVCFLIRSSFAFTLVSSNFAASRAVWLVERAAFAVSAALFKPGSESVAAFNCGGIAASLVWVAVRAV